MHAVSIFGVSVWLGNKKSQKSETDVETLQNLVTYYKFDNLHRHKCLLAARGGKSIAEILSMLDSLDCEHYVVVYGDLYTFRKIYSHLAKKRIEGNEVAVLLPYYETIDRVRFVLGQSRIDVRTQEIRGYLSIMDSYATYLGFQHDNALLFNRLVQRAPVSKKSRILIMADMGAFFLIGQVAKIARRN